jgi:sugar lactone lactonase YvrE
MPDRPLRTVLDGWSYLECPRWHDGRVYVSDFYTEQVLAVGLDGGPPGFPHNDDPSLRRRGRGQPETVARVPGQPSGLGWLPDGSMLVVSMRDRRVLRLRTGEAEPEVHAVLSELAPWHLNDMVVDAAGRAFVGNFGFDLMSGAPIQATSLIRVEPDGGATVVAEDLRFPNGTVIFPDGATLVVAETLGGRLTAFDVTGDGALANRRPWAVLSEVPDSDDLGELLASGAIAPDGIALDADGAIWVADALGGRALRVREGGEIVDQVTAGGLGIFACGLGGADGRTLLLCSAPSFAEHERRAAREAQLLACEVDVPRAGWP